MFMPLAQPLLNNVNQRYEVTGGEQQKNSIFNANKQNRAPFMGGKNSAEIEPAKDANVVSEGLNSRFKWKPSSIGDFGTVTCKATNEIGSTECTYELKLGGEKYSIWNTYF